jgi:hypothetical protein
MDLTFLQDFMYGFGEKLEVYNMNFCHIVPSAFVKQTDFHISKYHLLLTHLAEKNSEYVNEYRKLSEKGHTLIMDNSFFEFQQCPPIDKIVEAAKLTKSTFIILPDTFIGKEEHLFKEKIKDMVSLIPKKYKKSGVVTGTSILQAKRCFDIMLNEIDEIDMICIPDRMLVDKLNIERWEFLNLLQKELSWDLNSKHIHLLALDNPYELPKLRRDWVNTLDTTMPFKAGWHRVKLPVSEKAEPKRPANYFDIQEIDEEQREVILHNLQWFKTCMNGGI